MIRNQVRNKGTTAITRLVSQTTAKTLKKTQIIFQPTMPLEHSLIKRKTIADSLEYETAETVQQKPNKKIHFDGILPAKKGPIVFWFRKDLRITDNTGLHRASVEAHFSDGTDGNIAQKSENETSLSGALISIFVICGQQWHHHDMAPVKLDFMFRNLKSLQMELESKFHIPLVLLSAPSIQDVPLVIREFCRQHKVASLHYNMEYEIDEFRRDHQLKELLQEDSVHVYSHHDECVVAPEVIKTKNGNCYNVFTPYKDAWCKYLKCIGSETTTMELLTGSPVPYCNSKGLFEKLPDALRRMEVSSQNVNFDTCVLQNSVPDPTLISIPGYQRPFDSPSLIEKVRKGWPTGEEAAKARLHQFSLEILPHYAKNRNIPSVKGTSSLSAYLALGVLSARQCVLKAYESNSNKLDSGNASHVTWISEVTWRDFYRERLVLYPRLSMNQPYQLETRALAWCEGEKATELFKQWCEGQTGYPIVDAAMRQLNTTGWMHNRLRMIAATFLTKDLLIDWRWGEKYFMQHLIDGDLASNNGGWQWCASTGGPTSQPYFRIFNPITQSEKFDPEGQFIKTFVPELSNVPKKYIHQPHLLSGAEFKKLKYPMPIVNHSEARLIAIEAFKKLKPVAG